MGSRKGKRNQDEKEKFAIVKLVEANVMQRAVAKQFKLSRSAICKVIKKHRETASTIRRKKGTTTKIEYCSYSYIKRIVLKKEVIVCICC